MKEIVLIIGYVLIGVLNTLVFIAGLFGEDTAVKISAFVMAIGEVLLLRFLCNLIFN